MLGRGRAAERSKEKSHIYSSIQRGRPWGKMVFAKVKGSPALLETEAEETPAMGTGKSGVWAIFSAKKKKGGGAVKIKTLWKGKCKERAESQRTPHSRVNATA